jgi:hypothetical protein
MFSPPVKTPKTPRSLDRLDEGHAFAAPVTRPNHYIGGHQLAASRTLPFAKVRWVMLYVPQRRIIGGRLPQDSATSEIESQELLYHSWPTPKSGQLCAISAASVKKDRAIIAREPIVASVRSVRLVLVWPFAAAAAFVW